MSEFPVALSLEPRKYSIGKMAKMNDSRNSSRRDSELLDQDANVTVTMNTPQPKMESPRHMAQNGDQKYRNWTKSTKNSSGSLVSTSAKTKHFSDSKLINPCILSPKSSPTDVQQSKRSSRFLIHPGKSQVSQTQHSTFKSNMRHLKFVTFLFAVSLPPFSIYLFVVGLYQTSDSRSYRDYVNDTFFESDYKLRNDLLLQSTIFFTAICLQYASNISQCSFKLMYNSCCTILTKIPATLTRSKSSANSDVKTQAVD